ncbi:MAG: hypothetical protein KDJ89_05255 [Notoacmeibacter sp.]|nr:hypothetical protein [Notoacmeibacter sp.]
MNTNKPVGGIFLHPVREHGVDGITRFEALSKVIGHWIRQARQGKVTMEEAWQAVCEHNAALIRPPWDEAELRREFEALLDVDAINHPPMPSVEPPDRSEDAIAASFVGEVGNAWRYVPASGIWRHWNGHQWVHDRVGAIREEIRIACRKAAIGLESGPARRIASNRTITAVQSIVSADPAIATAPEAWDRDEMLLNTRDGILDLTSGNLQDPDPDALMSRCAAASVGSAYPLWLSFLDQVCGRDHSLVAYLARVCGYCLTGSTREQVFFFLHGDGANGKSVFLSTISTVLGSYATTAPSDAFMSSRSDRHPTDMAGLAGARLVTITETEADRNWAESRIKAITGGELISARFMHRDFFQYRPNCKLIIAGNHLPNLSTTGEAMRRRLHIVPFAVTIPADKRDKDLANRLLQERDGILRWMVDGCADWQRIGLSPPDAVTDARDAYFREEDIIGQWIEACCETNHAFETLSSDLYGSWKAWAEREGHEARSPKSLGEALRLNGFRAARTNRGRIWQGIRLRSRGGAAQ